MCDRPDVYRETLRRSRKARKCCECGWTIEVGDTYQNAFGAGRDGSYNYSTCLPCVKVRKQVESGLGAFECWYFTTLCDDVDQTQYRTPEMDLFVARLDYRSQLEERDRWLQKAADEEVPEKAQAWYRLRADECLFKWAAARDELKAEGYKVAF